METLGVSLSPRLRSGVLIYFSGPIGAGKTTLIRGILHGLGSIATVKSPTYTLVEPHVITTGLAYHFDLFRLQDPMELELVGVRDYMDGSALCLVEWPERAAGILPAPDAAVSIAPQQQGRMVDWRWRAQTIPGSS